VTRTSTSAGICAHISANLPPLGRLKAQEKNSGCQGDPQNFTPSQVRNLKEFYGDFFDSQPRANEAKALGKETGEAFQELINQLAPLAAQTSQYPFLNALTPVHKKLKELSGKPYAWFLTDLSRQENELLDLKEKVIDPIRKFMSGPQKTIFDNARQFVQTQDANFSYIEGDDSSLIIDALADPECFQGNRMQQVKALVDNLQVKVTTQIGTEITLAKEATEALKDRLCGMAEFAVLSSEQQEQITQPFSEFIQSVERQKLIAVIRDTLRRFEESEYQRLLSKMATLTRPAPQEKAGQGNQTSTTTPESTAKTVIQEPRIEYVPSRLVRVSFNKAWLADESDVDRYLESMRVALLTEIRNGKRIQI